MSRVTNILQYCMCASEDSDQHSQADQSVRCPPKKALAWLPTEYIATTSDCADTQADLSLHLAFVGTAL